AIKPLSPKVIAISRADQLSGNAHARCCFSNASFQDVVYTKLPSDLLHFDCFAFVSEGGMSRYDEKRGNFRQISDDIFGNPIPEVFLLGIAAHVCERQNCDRWPAFDL